MNFVPHQGQFFEGNRRWIAIVLLESRRLHIRRVVRSRSLSPSYPIRLGVAAAPTQSPISNGHSPSFSFVLFPLQLQRTHQSPPRDRAGPG